MDKDALNRTPSFGGVIRFSFPGLPWVRCAFSTARAGSMAVGKTPEEERACTRNRQQLLRGLNLTRWVELQQVHGDTLLADAEPTDPAAPVLTEADGAATRSKGLALAIKTADCQPLLLADADGRAVAALHVGWRGNVMNFPGTGLERFCSLYGLEPSRTLAVRGPSLGPDAAEFINFDSEWPPAFRPWFDEAGKTMNLWELTKNQLLRAGMPPGNIYTLDFCTRSLPGDFFSHRRGDSGRQVSLIWIEED